MKKRIILLVGILIIVFFYFKNKKVENGVEYAYTMDTNVPSKYKLIVFNNLLRKQHGMTLVDSVKLDSSFVKKIKEKEWIHFKNVSTNLKKDEVFEIAYSPSTNIVLDYYKIGKDSLFRIQSRIRDGKYVRDLFGMLITKENSEFLSFNQIMDTALDKGLIKENDTLFYGYRVYNTDDDFIPEKRIDPFYNEIDNW